MAEGPLHIPSPARSVLSLSGVTPPRPSRCSDLVSGLRNPGPNPRPSLLRLCARIGREAGAAASPPLGPRQRTGKPGRKGKGRRAPARRPLPGIPSSQAALRPFFSPSPPSGADGGGSLPVDPGLGEGARRGWRSNPRGGKLGGRQRDSGPAGAAGGVLRSPAGPRPGSRDGRRGSARTGSLRAPGAGLRFWGARLRIPRRRRRRLGSAARLGLRAWRAARARAGAGSGRPRSRPGAWAQAAPPLHAGTSHAPACLRVKSWAPAARPRADLGAPATESGPRGHDRRAQTRHTRYNIQILRRRFATATYAHGTGKHPGTRVYTLTQFTDVGTPPQPSPLWTRDLTLTFQTPAVIDTHRHPHGHRQTHH